MIDAVERREPKIFDRKKQQLFETAGVCRGCVHLPGQTKHLLPRDGHLSLVGANIDLDFITADGATHPGGKRRWLFVCFSQVSVCFLFREQYSVILRTPAFDLGIERAEGLLHQHKRQSCVGHACCRLPSCRSHACFVLLRSPFRGEISLPPAIRTG